MYHCARNSSAVSGSVSVSSSTLRLMTFSANFLMTYSLRSSNTSLRSSGAARNSCAICGMRARAHSPMPDGSTGTSRQPIGSTPWCRAELSSDSLQNLCKSAC